MLQIFQMNEHTPHYKEHFKSMFRIFVLLLSFTKDCSEFFKIENIT